MSPLLRHSFVALIACCLVSPLASQDRQRPAQADSNAGNRGIPAGSAVANPGMAPAISRQPSYGESQSSGRTAYASNYNAISPTPVMPAGASFCSLDSYLGWLSFVDHMQSQYALNSLYFSRFIRNSEPLVTPQLVQLTAKQPLGLSERLLLSVDELRSLIADSESGKSVDGRALVARTQEIRSLAKKIRKDQMLAFYDLRQKRDILNRDAADKSGGNPMVELRELAVQLNLQLKDMYNASKTSTVGVETFRQPSFDSLSKAIERLSKVIENSAAHL